MVIIHTSKQDIQILVKFQALSGKASLCLLNSVPLHPQLPFHHLHQLASRIQGLAFINGAIKEGNGRQTSLPQTPWLLVYSLCLTFLIMILRTPSSAGFQFS